MKQVSTPGRRLEPHLDRLPWTRWLALTGFLLIVCAFFFVDWRALQAGTSNWKFNVPTATTGIVLPSSYGLVSINRQGTIRVSSGDGVALPVATVEEFRTTVQATVDEYPDRPFVLIAPDHADPKAIELTLSVLREAGVKQVVFQTVLPQ